jgi:hypothetical protein
MPRRMSWPFKKLGNLDREYRGDDFSVRVEQGFREIVTVVHTRRRTARRLEGELIGKRWEGIAVHLPRNIDPADLPQIVRDLETAFGALRCGYVISRAVRVDPVSEAEQEAAITELNEMGFEVERSTDSREIVLRPKSGVPRPDTKTAQSRAPRIMALVQALGGTRPRVELLAKSKEFATDYTDYIPR